MFRTCHAFQGDRYRKARFLRLFHQMVERGALERGTYGRISEIDDAWCGTAVALALRTCDMMNGGLMRMFGEQHLELARYLGIPIDLVNLFDWVFENIPDEEHAQLWPGRFFNAIGVGTDLSHVWPELRVLAQSYLPEGIDRLLVDYVYDHRLVRDEQWEPYRMPDGLGIPAAASVAEMMLGLLRTSAMRQEQEDKTLILASPRGDLVFQVESVRPA
jgi:hypothetical protein